MDWLERVKQEQKDLQCKIDSLQIFLNKTTYPCSLTLEEKELLTKQLVVMKDYNSILLQRLELHNNSNDMGKLPKCNEYADCHSDSESVFL